MSNYYQQNYCKKCQKITQHAWIDNCLGFREYGVMCDLCHTTSHPEDILEIKSEK